MKASERSGASNESRYQTVTKRCPRCQTVKPWSDFTPRTRWEDGTVRNVQANCKACNAELCREWRRRRGESPDTRRQRQNRWVANLDPERKAIRRDVSREWWRRKLGVEPQNYRTRGRAQHGGPTVDPTPFVEWLRSFNVNPQQTARIVGMEPRRVRSLMNGEQARVELDTVDRALCNYGRPDLLNILYPPKAKVA